MASYLEEVLFLSLAGFADANDGRRGNGARRGRQKITFQRVTTRPRNRNDLAAWSSMAKILAGAFAHAFDRGLTILVREIERRRRGLIVADRPKPVASRRQHTPVAESVIGAPAARIGGLLPLGVPGLIVGKTDAACGSETLGDRCPAFLRRAQQARELDRQVFLPGPVGPSLNVDFKSHAVDVQSTSLSVTLSIDRSFEGNSGWRIAARLRREPSTIHTCRTQ